MKVTLGGDRIGSGNKMPVHLKHYERSTHNLSTNYKTSAGIGILYPCYCKPALRGDKFELNIAAGVRTVPSKGAMFGTYKLQVDYYFCPVRLYTGILHNNPVNIGLKMDKIYFPQVETYYKQDGFGKKKIEFSTSSLMHYLGLSGMGHMSGTSAKRAFNAIPILAYYDIFKNYYSNKQEPNAYVLCQSGEIQVTYISGLTDEYTSTEININSDGNLQKSDNVQFDDGDFSLELRGEYLDTKKIMITCVHKDDPQKNMRYSLYDYVHTLQLMSIEDEDETFVQFISDDTYHEDWGLEYDYLYIEYTKSNISIDSGLTLQDFPLTNIDDMRTALLSYHTLGAPYKINDFNKYPYLAVAAKDNSDNYHANNMNPLNGLMIKTYQSDIFNNWLSSEFIEGINGIANITRVSTEGGGFTIDALNFSEKMYNLLNRIVVSGNTYEDWQNVVYENTPKRHLESPLYLGGISQEIVFEEIVATAAADSPIGTMGGRGISRHRKGGKIRAKFDEAGFIIGIMSITPRIDYSQGNEFFFTDVFTMDDFHKPGLDGIGFQDLIGERMAYFDTECFADGHVKRHSIGKLPAWIEYMTDVDKVHGELADGDVSFMVLNRNYEFDNSLGCIKDATTYIEPNKYNYAFYYTERDAQNFWVQIQHTIPARRKMSARLIPNI